MRHAEPGSIVLNYNPLSIIDAIMLLGELRPLTKSVVRLTLYVHPGENRVPVRPDEVQDD